MKQLVIFLLFSFISFASNEEISNYWQEVMKDFNLNPDKHGFCLMDEDENIHGETAHLKVRLASVSKPVTSLYALNKLGADKRYKTIINVHKNDIHIQGDFDPVTSSKKLFYIANQLKNIGLTSIGKINFDSKFPVFSWSEKVPLSEWRPKIRDQKNDLIKHFNILAWDKDLKEEYESFYNSLSYEQRVENQIINDLKQLNLTAKSAHYYIKDLPFDLDKATKYSISSSSLKDYIKYTNIVSNNYIADRLYLDNGDAKAFNLYLKEKVQDFFSDYDSIRVGFKENEPSAYFYTGSGLDSKIGKRRVDNYATCAIIMKSLKKLNNYSFVRGEHLKDYLAVVGSDGGTFQRRLRSKKLQNSIVAKTGTLMNTSALAGVIYTKKGPIYFGLFHQLTGHKGNAKMVQDLIVNKIADTYGVKRFDYKLHQFKSFHKTIERER